MTRQQLLPTNAIRRREIFGPGQLIDGYDLSAGRKINRIVPYSCFRLLTTLLLFFSLFTQAAFGTIILVRFEPEGILVAADSREGTGISDYNDHACKITALDANTFFAADGDIGSKNFKGEFLWNAVESAKNAASVSSLPDDKYRGGRISATWGMSAIEQLSRIHNYQPGPIPVEGIFGTGSKDGIRLFDVRVIYEQSSATEGMSPWMYAVLNMFENPGGMRGFGSPDAKALVAELLAGQTERAKVGLAEFAKAKSAADQMKTVIETVSGWKPNNDSFGGPVDVLILEKATGKLRWIYQKPECAQKNKRIPK